MVDDASIGVAEDPVVCVTGTPIGNSLPWAHGKGDGEGLLAPSPAKAPMLHCSIQDQFETAGFMK